ncbi:MAG: thioredoxin-like domain-containing protein [Candidatus Spyradosoma sp.]
MTVLLTAAFALGAGVPAIAQQRAVPEAAVETAGPWGKIFPSGLIAAGEKASKASKNHFRELDGKFVGVYFSAKWCGYCHYFTPQLEKFQKKHKARFAVVFSSSDKTESDMIAYVKQYKMNKQKWLATPFGSRPAVAAGGGLPTLIVLAPDGSMLTQITGASKAMQAREDDPRLFKDLAEKMSDWSAAHADK